jgi:DNA-binding transcriptional LysR family regulator
MLKLQQVRQLTIAAATGSFKAAAAGTFRSQAAVSIAMRELEKTVGGQLLERDRRGKFTPLAQALIPLFQDLLTRHDQVLKQAQQLALGEQGSLSIAVAPFLAEQWLPEVIAAFVERHPGVRVRTIEERSSRIRGLLVDGTVDIGVAGLLGDDPKLSILPVASDAYGVLCNPEHPFARRRSTSWASLRNERIIGSDAYEALTAAGLVPRLPTPELSITSRAPLLALVRKNLGITVLPMLTRPDASAGFAFVPLTRPRLARRVAVVTRSSESLLPAGQRLAAMLAASLREFARRRGAPP